MLMHQKPQYYEDISSSQLFYRFSVITIKTHRHALFVEIDKLINR